MTADEFRKIALSLPEASESSHMCHPDFRVRGKIFATLYPGETLGMVKLTPEQQEALTKAEPKVFTPVKGAWGRRGCTTINLRAAPKTTARRSLTLAWLNTAPKRLAGESKIGVD